MHHLLAAAYAAALCGLVFFGIHRLKIVWLYLWHGRRKAGIPAEWRGEVPLVCVQCPVFNEPAMVEGLLEAITQLDWPLDRLEIQLLDDSTDATTALIERWLRDHPERSLPVRLWRRQGRRGYKAGALAEGMAKSYAEFFAIFDADFRPAPDFLRRLMPGFLDSGVGVVQARWEFANRERNLLTRFQGVFLDAHFVVEQAARSASGLFFNFNGTAGIWRRRALEEAGGWTADTVTEDLDASYRAQLLGWRFLYAADVPVASELPQSLAAFKAQQHRWTKGGIQVARKLLGSVLRSGAISNRVKAEAFYHLTIGFVHLVLVFFAALLVPFLFWIGPEPEGSFRLLHPLTVLLAGAATMTLYVTGQFFRERRWREGLLWLVAAPGVMAFGLALSLTCAVAVIEGLVARGGEFVRTPKGGGRPRARRSGVTAGVAVAEWIFGAVMLAGAVHFWAQGTEWVSGMLAIKAAAFLGVAFYSTRELWPAARSGDLPEWQQAPNL